MTDAFANLVSPVIRHVIDLQHGLGRGEHPPWEGTRQRIMVLLGEAEQKASVSSQLAHDFVLARHALVYWADEVLINSPWQHAGEWRQHILEWDLYRERLRANRFFEKAAEAEALAGTDPLEAYFLCVALGFRGQLGDSEPALRQWVDRVYARIASGSHQPDRFLPDEPGDDRGPLRPLPGKTTLLVVSILVAGTALVTLVSFLASVHLAE